MFFSSRAVVKWIRRTAQRFPLRMIGPHHELSRFEATWRSGDYFVYLLMWYKQTWSTANQTVIFFTIYFFLYLLIILNIDENTTSLFIGFRGGDFIDSVYVFDRLLVLTIEIQMNCNVHGRCECMTRYFHKHG